MFVARTHIPHARRDDKEQYYIITSLQSLRIPSNLMYNNKMALPEQGRC